RDELGGLPRRYGFEELGSQLFVEVLEDVCSASGPECPEERLELFTIEQLRDAGEVGGGHLPRLGRDITRRRLEQGDDIGREQCRDRTVFRISLRWSHWPS